MLIYQLITGLLQAAVSAFADNDVSHCDDVSNFKCTIRLFGIDYGVFL